MEFCAQEETPSVLGAAHSLSCASLLTPLATAAAGSVWPGGLCNVFYWVGASAGANVQRYQIWCSNGSKYLPVLQDLLGSLYHSHVPVFIIDCHKDN